MTDKNSDYSLVNRLRAMAAIGWNSIGEEAAVEIEALQVELVASQSKENALEEQLRVANIMAESNYESDLDHISDLERQLAELKTNANVLVEALDKSANHVRPTCSTLYNELQQTITTFKEQTK